MNHVRGIIARVSTMGEMRMRACACVVVVHELRLPQQLHSHSTRPVFARRLSHSATGSGPGQRKQTGSSRGLSLHCPRTLADSLVTTAETSDTDCMFCSTELHRSCCGSLQRDVI